MPKPSFFDTHLHLALLRDPAGCIDRALGAGVNSFLDVSVGLSDYITRARRVQELKARFEDAGIFFTVGIPPYFSDKREPGDVEEVLHQADESGADAIGEIGLDNYHDWGTRKQQIELFTAQLEVSRDLNLPVVIHSREADRDLVQILKGHAPERRGIIHCFSSGPRTARELLDLGFYISFAGNVTYRRSDPIREAAKLIPGDRYLIETDAPYLSPEGHRREKNEPAFLRSTARFIAELRSINLEELGEQTGRNARRVLGLS